MHMCWHLYKSISLRISPNTGQECALVYAQLHMGISLKLALKMVRNVRWLGEEALKRYLKLRPPSFVPNREEVSFTTLSYFVSLNIS